MAAGQYQEAGAAVSNWLTARPGSSEAHLLKGRVALANGNLNEAAEELKRRKLWATRVTSWPCFRL